MHVSIGSHLVVLKGSLAPSSSVGSPDVRPRTGMEYRYMPPIRRLIEESDSRCAARA